MFRALYPRALSVRISTCRRRMCAATSSRRVNSASATPLSACLLCSSTRRDRPLYARCSRISLRRSAVRLIKDLAPESVRSVRRYLIHPVPGARPMSMTSPRAAAASRGFVASAPTNGKLVFPSSLPASVRRRPPNANEIVETRPAARRTALLRCRHRGDRAFAPGMPRNASRPSADSGV